MSARLDLMNTEHKNNCLICREELIYSESARPLECAYCGRTFDSNVACAAGHYICDECHGLSARDVIRQFTIQSKSTDPLQMALELMRHPSVKMHGPEHHFLVPAVLLSAYYNFKETPELKESKIKEAWKRSGNVLGGFCGFYGTCGAAMGTGIFISLITDTTPLSVDTWRLSNLVTAKSLTIIAEKGGPRCCKRNTFLAIIEAVELLKEYLGVSLPASTDIKCEFFKLNKECLKSACPFHPAGEKR